MSVGLAQSGHQESSDSVRDVAVGMGVGMMLVVILAATAVAVAIVLAVKLHKMTQNNTLRGIYVLARILCFLVSTFLTSKGPEMLLLLKTKGEQNH